jgi:predicted O-methyltransferase YrrM
MHAEFLSKVSAYIIAFKNMTVRKQIELRAFAILSLSLHSLAQLVHIQQPQQVLEIGTSTGYSTLWLACSITSECSINHFGN